MSVALDFVTLVASSTSCSSPKRAAVLFQAGGCLKRSMLKSPKSKLFALQSVALYIILTKSSGHPWDNAGFLYTYPTSNGFVLESFISTQMHPERERERDRQTDRQTDGRTDRQTDTDTDTDIETDK